MTSKLLYISSGRAAVDVDEITGLLVGDSATF